MAFLHYSMPGSTVLHQVDNITNSSRMELSFPSSWSPVQMKLAKMRWNRVNLEILMSAGLCWRSSPVLLNPRNVFRGHTFGCIAARFIFHLLSFAKGFSFVFPKKNIFICGGINSFSCGVSHNSTPIWNILAQTKGISTWGKLPWQAHKSYVKDFKKWTTRKYKIYSNFKFYNQGKI